MTNTSNDSIDGGDEWIRPTTASWQTIRAAADVPVLPQPPFRYSYPARLPDGSYLDLPLRRMAGAPGRAVASLIANQASFDVVEALAGFMAELARPLSPEVIVGLPTLGFAFAPLVAQRLGLPNFVPLGYSRKFWYDEALSVPVRSLTTPEAGKTLYLDPNLLPRLKGMRAVVIDDAVSSGQTTSAALDLLAKGRAGSTSPASSSRWCRDRPGVRISRPWVRTGRSACTAYSLRRGSQRRRVAGCPRRVPEIRYLSKDRRR